MVNFMKKIALLLSVLLLLTCETLIEAQEKSIKADMFFETAIGRVTPSLVGEENNPEYDELKDCWTEENDGG
jgi:hypothetical protein